MLRSSSAEQWSANSLVNRNFRSTPCEDSTLLAGFIPEPTRTGLYGFETVPQAADKGLPGPFAAGALTKSWQVAATDLIALVFVASHSHSNAGAESARDSYACTFNAQNRIHATVMSRKDGYSRFSS